MSPKRPPLSSKDLKLWKKVADSVQPLEGRASDLKALIETLDGHNPSLHPDKSEGQNPDKPTGPKIQRASQKDLEALKHAGMSGNPVRSQDHIAPLHPLDKREKKYIRKGRIGIESRLDLHGLTQKEAHAALFGFLRASQAQGYKHVLVITGKGSRGEPDPYAARDGQGILRRVVPKWLAEPEIRSIIVGFEEAHRSLGGSGALHIRLRSRNKHKPAS
ncbi:MAG: Smr/MutS family protein [Cohaesibacter sp.]|jgi:DNA-nicking Smr family endonuclease|nr:Smr/MutS family protein [Cohaesibacter sp.]